MNLSQHQLEANLYLNRVCRKPVAYDTPVWENIYKSDAQFHQWGAPFNFGMVEYGGEILGVYRIDRVDERGCGINVADVVFCKIGGIGLEPEKFMSYSHRVLPLQGIKGSTLIEDPRLFVFRDKIYVSYVSATGKGPWTCAIGIAEIDRNGNVLSDTWWPHLRNNCDEKMQPLTVDKTPIAMEKNWIYFDSNDKLYLIYACYPHVTIELDIENRKVGEEKGLPFGFKGWPGGEERGGTIPVRVGDEFFTFFHSSFYPPKPNDYATKLYNMGCYAFKAEKPFMTCRMTPKILMAGEKGETRNTAIVFPCGAIYKKGVWLISYGFNDMECRLVTMRHDKLLSLMKEKQSLTNMEL